MPWVCIGNYNKITRLGEKSGRSIRVESQMQNFGECLDFCGLKDLGFPSLPLTWCNRRFDGIVIMATADWLLKFPLVRLHHLSRFSSNHKSIWLYFDNVCGLKMSAMKGWFTPLGIWVPLAIQWVLSCWRLVIAKPNLLHGIKKCLVMGLCCWQKRGRNWKRPRWFLCLEDVILE